MTTVAGAGRREPRSPPITTCDGGAGSAAVDVLDLEVLAIREPIDVFGARRAVRATAAVLGFDNVACHELAIVVSELATNVLKYGVRGEIALASVDHPQLGAGIRISARDEGPGIVDFEEALRDGYEESGPIDPGKLLTRSGIGSGLGAVSRLSDELDYVIEAGAKLVRATRYARRPRR